ncbi:protein YIPF1 homolog [Cucurbita pepo subsp. pepo]|uniref:protein YIPF1 homolog n=1 Tax=Cucurbita pepo subsp. pepo TaxID=3664 RepID=UPI000C9D4F0A|nr:protein YIPF1 homolog [Cucurbita pepo subsp. pepo]
MDETYINLPTSHLLGSVPAVINEEKDGTDHKTPEASMQTFPPTNGRDRGRGYQTLESPNDPQPQPSSNWKGMFSVSSYTQYFNVDTDTVMNRLISSLYPIGGDFSSKIDANPDLYGLVWVTTTLVFVLAAFGNCATFLMQKQSDHGAAWSFDVSYVNVAAGSVYGYAIVVPTAFYFSLQYLGSNSNLIRFWCLWGYSLFIFILASFLLLIPVEILRWFIILLSGAASASFVTLNLRSYIDGNDLSVLIVAAFFLQMALAIFIKVWFFP